MKRIFITLLMISGVASVSLISCKKDEVKATATVSASSASQLSASSTSPVLAKSNLTGTAVTFTGTNPNYGYSAAVNNSLQLDVKGDNFAKPQEVALAAGTISKAYTVQDFNNLLLSMNLPTTSSSQIEVRIKSALSATAGIVYSNVVTLTVQPFALVSFVYVPGAYQGWNPATADSLQSATGNGVYTGIINFTAGNLEFKVTPAKKWDVAYGDAGSGTVSTSGGNLNAPAAGEYYITLDLNAKTISFAPADYFSVIGNAAPGVAWSTDTDLKYNNGNLAWEGTMAFTVGEYKFRVNHDWSLSFGIPKTGADGVTLNNNDNNNIPVTVAGTYKTSITPMYDPANPGKVLKSATAKYTLVKQ